MKLSLFGFVAIAGLALASAVSAASVRVSQESSAGAADFDANVLGFIQAYDYSASGSVADFYSYNNPINFSYNGQNNGGPTGTDGQTQSFFVIGNDGIGLVTLHDAPNDGTGGNAIMTHTVIGGVADAVAYMVRDDTGDGNLINDIGGDRAFTTRHTWQNCCTDGSAIGDLGSNFIVYSEFDGSPSGLSIWYARGSQDEDILLSMASDRRVRFDIVGEVPLPASGMFLIGALGAIGVTRRLRKSH